MKGGGVEMSADRHDPVDPTRVESTVNWMSFRAQQNVSFPFAASLVMVGRSAVQKIKE